MTYVIIYIKKFKYQNPNILLIITMFDIVNNLKDKNK